METGVRPGHQEARLLLSAFLGLECHPWESLSLRDAGLSGLWKAAEACGVGGAGGPHRPGCKALGRGFPQAFLITGGICALQIVWFSHLARSGASHY